MFTDAEKCFNCLILKTLNVNNTFLNSIIFYYLSQNQSLVLFTNFIFRKK